MKADAGRVLTPFNYFQNQTLLLQQTVVGAPLLHKGSYIKILFQVVQASSQFKGQDRFPFREAHVQLLLLAWQVHAQKTE